MNKDIVLYCGDCLEEMAKVSDKSVDLVLCDLPYGTTACAWDSVIPLDELWKHYKRILKPQGSVLLFGSEPFSTMLRMSNIAWYKYDWIWHKSTTTGFQHAKNMPLKDFEIVSVFSPASMGHAKLLGERRMTYNPQGLKECHHVSTAAKGKFNGCVGKRPSQKDYVVQDYTNYPTMTLNFDSETTNYHPTQKPVNLLEYLIRTYTDEEGMVLDNTMGSGSTGVAAVKAKRGFIGIEKDAKYFATAKDRIDCEALSIPMF